VSFVLNYEEGAERNVLHGDAGSEDFLSEVVGARSFPGRHMSVESLYEYGSRVGFWRVMGAFADAGLPLTVFGVAEALRLNPEAVAAIVEAGHEVACHGLRWLSYQETDPEQERADMAAATALITELTGTAPLGWYTGRDSPRTRRLLVEHGGYLYDSDSYADDLPYWVQVGDVAHLVVPYTLDNNDMRFLTPQGFNSGEQLFTYLRDAFDTLYGESATVPRMMSIGLHCRIVGHPGRMPALLRFVDHVTAHPEVWVCRRVDIARHWVREHPHPEGR
jgi:allantoinase